MNSEAKQEQEAIIPPPGECIENELLNFMNNFGRLPNRSFPVLFFPPGLGPILMKSIRYQSAIYDMAAIYIGEDENRIVAVCRKQFLRKYYQDRYNDIFLYAEDCEPIDGTHLNNCLTNMLASMARRKVRQQMNLPQDVDLALDPETKEVERKLLYMSEKQKPRKASGTLCSVTKRTSSVDRATLFATYAGCSSENRTLLGNLTAAPYEQEYGECMYTHHKKDNIANVARQLSGTAWAVGAGDYYNSGAQNNKKYNCYSRGRKVFEPREPSETVTETPVISSESSDPISEVVSNDPVLLTPPVTAEGSLVPLQVFEDQNISQHSVDDPNNPLYYVYSLPDGSKIVYQAGDKAQKFVPTTICDISATEFVPSGEVSETKLEHIPTTCLNVDAKEFVPAPKSTVVMPPIQKPKCGSLNDIYNSITASSTDFETDKVDNDDEDASSLDEQISDLPPSHLSEVQQLFQSILCENQKELKQEASVLDVANLTPPLNKRLTGSFSDIVAAVSATKKVVINLASDSDSSETENVTTGISGAHFETYRSNKATRDAEVEVTSFQEDNRSFRCALNKTEFSMEEHFFENWDNLFQLKLEYGLVARKYVGNNVMIVLGLENYTPYKDKKAQMMEHIIELYGFPRPYLTQDLLRVFQEEPRYIKWCDDTHALLITGSPEQARRALQIKNVPIKSRPMTEAGPVATLIACRCNLMPAASSIRSVQSKNSARKPRSNTVKSRRFLTQYRSYSSRRLMQ